MYRSHSRNMQRIGQKVSMGTAAEREAVALAPAMDQIRYADMVRMARIREVFALERKLKRASGEEARRLQAWIDGLKSGRIDPCLPPKKAAKAKARPPRPSPDPARAGRAPAHAPAPRAAATGIARALERDLTDLAKGEVTAGGAAIVKTLLASMQAGTVSGMTGATVATIATIAASDAFKASPKLTARAGAVLIEVLKERR